MIKQVSSSITNIITWSLILHPVFICSCHDITSRDLWGKFIGLYSSNLFMGFARSHWHNHISNHTSPTSGYKLVLLCYLERLWLCLDNIYLGCTKETTDWKPITWHHHHKFNILPAFLWDYYSTRKQKQLYVP